MNREESILACTLRRYAFEQLVEKLAIQSRALERIAKGSDSVEHSQDRADSALRNSGVSEDL